MFEQEISAAIDEQEISAAIDVGNLEKIIQLIEKGAAPDTKGTNGMSPLLVAAKKGDVDAIKEIIAGLLKALREKTIVMSDLLKARNMKNKEGQSALHLATMSGSVAAVNTLLDAGVRVDTQDSDGNTPLHLAASNRSFDIIEALLKKDAQVNIVNTNGETPLHCATITTCLDISYQNINALLEKGADVKAKDNAGRTPLHLLFNQDLYAPSVVSLLIEHGSDLEAADNDGNTPLHLAADNCLPLNGLINAHAKVNAPNHLGDTPLHVCVRSRHHYDKIKITLDSLIAAKANLDAVNNDGNTPLHLAILRGDPKILNTLILNHANVKTANHDGNTPLHLAAKYGNNRQIFETLLANGADVHAVNQAGETPLAILSKISKPSAYQKCFMTLLIQHGAISPTSMTLQHVEKKSDNGDVTKEIIAESAPKSVTSKQREVKYCEPVVKKFSEWLDEIRYNEIPIEQAISNVEDLFIQFPGYYSATNWNQLREPNPHLNELPKQHLDRLFDAVLASGNFQLAEALTRLIKAKYAVPEEIRNLGCLMSKKEERAGKLLLPHFRRQQKEREARENVDVQTTPEDTLRCNP